MVDFLPSLLPDPVEVCGVRLKPFSLGHAAILERLDCACWWDGSRAPTADDLFTGVFVCSRTFREFTAAFYAGGDISGGLVADFEPEQLGGHADVFAAYIAGSMTGPTYEVRDDGKEHEKSGAHLFASIRVGLIKLGHDPKDVMDIPFGLALHDLATESERNGGIKIWTAQDAIDHEERKRLADEFDARWRAKGVIV